MSQIPPPYQMGSPDGGPPPKSSNKNVWIIVVIAMLAICGVCGIVGAAIMLPVFAQARLAAKSARDVSTAKQVSLSMIMYAADHDDMMPPFKSADEVTTKILPYMKNREITEPASRGYTWNTMVSGKSATEFLNAEKVWMFHSSTLDAGKKYELAYMDAHVKRTDPEMLDMIKSESEKIVKQATLK